VLGGRSAHHTDLQQSPNSCVNRNALTIFPLDKEVCGARMLAELEALGQPQALDLAELA
jgi:hypothetical protein